MRLKALCILTLGLWAGRVSAQPAALSSAQLKAASDLIVTGRVIATKKIGPLYTFDHCHMWQNFLADFEIQTTAKGRAEQTIQIFVPSVMRDLYPQKPCLQDEHGKLWLEPGERYQLFLKTSPQVDPTEFRLFHPSGIIPLKP